MRIPNSVTLLPLILFTLTSCATSNRAQRLPDVPPGKEFIGPYLNVTAPASPGWQLGYSGSKGMMFGRKGTEPAQTFIAFTGIFDFPNSKSNEELEAVARAQIQTGSEAARFEVVDVDLQPTTERAYYCLRYRATSKDKEALSAGGKRETLLLQMRALYCRHPTLQDKGLSIGYSHRNRKPLPNFDAEADEFINGVQVPGH